jgi:hypothetical protein
MKNEDGHHVHCLNNQLVSQLTYLNSKLLDSAKNGLDCRESTLEMVKLIHIFERKVKKILSSDLDLRNDIVHTKHNS